MGLQLQEIGTLISKKLEFIIEVNMYESKLFQDATVESKNTQMTNPFGSVAFIGKTEQFGEQWLYTRSLFSSFPELVAQRQSRVILHLPKHSLTDEKIELYGIVSRFCSFASNWDNKINESNYITSSVSNGKYLSLDLTHFVEQLGKEHFHKLDGMLLKPKVKNKQPVVIATGDSYYRPQILEIRNE